MLSKPTSNANIVERMHSVPVEPMRKDEAVQLLKEHADAIRAHGAISLYMFGSTVRDRASAGSDVDIFIDYDASRFSLIELVSLKDYLEQILRHPADVTTRDSLHPLLRDRVVAEAELIF